ncbi:biotin-dependent carboxyltransferase family protein, partial [Tamlana crocina]|nr:biotin-dependent carboxyltransferase family protein [Tamlana crocina]
LEITLQGPVLKFQEAAEIVITGADLSPVLDGEKLFNNHVVHVKAGRVLKFGSRISGFRAYVAIKNGFQTPEILKSRSWCKSVTPHHRLEKGMEIPFLRSGISASEKFSAVRSNTYLVSEI